MINRRHFLLAAFTETMIYGCWRFELWSWILFWLLMSDDVRANLSIISEHTSIHCLSTISEGCVREVVEVRASS